MTAPLSWPGRLNTLPTPADGSRRAQGGKRLNGAITAAPGGSSAGPLISYITVVRNGQATLLRTLKSVQAQTWPPVEHIVLDGLSSDGTLAIIEANAAHIDLYYSEADQGLYDALNKAISLAQGELICVLNADDWLHPDAAQQAAKTYLASGPGNPSNDACLVLTAATVHRQDRTKLWTPGRLDLGGYFSCPNICHNGVYATPAAYTASGPYNTDLRIAADSQWLLRCVDAGVQMLRSDHPTVHYCTGGLSSNLQTHTQDCAQIVQQRFPFLTEADVWALLHAFHAHRGNLQAFAAKRPAHLGRALDALARQHADKADFMSALALAGMASLAHPDDKGPAQKLSRTEKAQRSLRRRWIGLRATLGLG